ncbi:MAG: CHAT domain-containing tetratricopeptide repeat protein, partial [Chloroflexota bacterium]
NPSARKVLNQIQNQLPTDEILNVTPSENSSELFNQLLNHLYKHIAGNVNFALKLADFLLKLAERDLSEFEVIRMIGNQGSVYLRLNQNQDALDCFKRAEQYFQTAQDWLRVGAMQVNQVAALMHLEKYETAVSLSKVARESCALAGSQAQGFIGHLEINLGLIYRRLGQYTEAIKSYEKAELIFQELNAPLSVANILNNRAHLLKVIDQYQDANEHMLQARKIYVEHEVTAEIARTDLNLGSLAFQTGNLQEALQKLEEANQRLLIIKDPLQLGFVNWYRSFIFLKLNLWEEAIHAAKEAEARLQYQNKSIELAQSRLNQAIAFTELGLHPTSEKLQERARRGVSRIKNQTELWSVDVTRATLAFKANNIKKARRIATRLSNEISSQYHPKLKAQTLIILSKGLLSSPKPNLSNIKFKLNEAKNLIERNHFREEKVELLTLYAKVYEREGAFSQSINTLEMAVEQLEQLRLGLGDDELQNSFSDDKLEIYDALVSLYHRQQLDNTQTIEPLLQTISKMHILPIQTQSERSPKMSELLREETALLERWHWQNNRLEQRAPFTEAESARTPTETIEQQKQIEQQISQLRRRRQAFAPRDQNDDKSSILTTEILATLSDQEVYIVYYQADNEYHALVLDHEKAHSYPSLIEANSLSKLHQAWQFHIEDIFEVMSTDQRLAQRYLSKMYEALIRPLLPHIKAKKRLLLTLPLKWNDFPLDAAFDGDQYLAERFETVYVSSPQQLANRPPAYVNEWHHQCLMIGCSDNGRLRHVHQEVEQIAQSAPAAWQKTTIVEEKATVQAIKTAVQDATIIHIAAHVAYRKDNPIFSSIQLFDKSLTLSELSTIQLKKQPLVIFSSCDTASGVTKGSSVLNLGRGMFQAGAKHLILTQWPLEDMATAHFMNNFYTALNANLSNIPQALQEAQINAIKNGRHPFFWAGYVYSY